MPCNSDYLEANEKEKTLKETAELLVYVLERMGKTPDQDLVSAANDYYCNKDYVPDLCKEIKSLSEENFEAIVYDARCPKSRRLADWWERHERADKLEKENAIADADRLVKHSISSLKAAATKFELLDVDYPDEGFLDIHFDILAAVDKLEEIS